MNQSYKLVWNAVQQGWVVCGELAKGRKKTASVGTGLLAVLLGLLQPAYAAPATNALPTGESVVSGSATFDRSINNRLTINQQSARLISNWNSFDIGSAARVTFVQPDASSIALNRVTSGSPSEIFGLLNANGQLVVVNPAGMVFGAGSQVRAASLVASVLDISNADFNAGNQVYDRGISTGSIDNAGQITAYNGSVSLLAPGIHNSGSIKANVGQLALVNANRVTLQDGTPALNTASSVTGIIQNTGTLQATRLNNTGGRIILQGDLSQANSSVQLSGQLLSRDSGVSVSGKKIAVANLSSDNHTALTADSLAFNGIFDLNGTYSQLALNGTYALGAGAKINLIGSQSGFSAGGVSYTLIRDAKRLQLLRLNLTGNFVLAGDIDASETATWSNGAGLIPAGSTTEQFSGKLDGLGHVISDLTINRATDNVGLIGYASHASLKNISLANASIQGRNRVGALVGWNEAGTVENSHATGQVHATVGTAGGLVGQSSAGSSVSNSSAGVTVSASKDKAGGLIGANLLSTVQHATASGNATASELYAGGLIAYVESSDISHSTASGAVQASRYAGGLTGYGVSSDISYSTASGTVHAAGQNAGGLAGHHWQGSIEYSAASGAVTGGEGLVGGLVGYAGQSQISNSHASGVVSGGRFTGGLIGGNHLTPVSYSFATGAVTGEATGGLIGVNSENSTISWSYASGAVNGDWEVGGLIGWNLAGDVSNSYASGAVFAQSGTVGGLIGRHSSGAIDYSYATGNVLTLGNEAGGLIGNANIYPDAPGLNHSYATGNVEGMQSVGGLIGSNFRLHIADSYASGNVTGTEFVGGLAGFNYSNITNSYATGSASGTVGVGGLAGASAGGFVPTAITGSYASGNVQGTNDVGGLIGNNSTLVEYSYAANTVNATGNNVGGLVGANMYGGKVSNTYASGTLLASGGNVGGLIGQNAYGATATNSYWNISTSGLSNAVGFNQQASFSKLVGLSASQMKSAASFGNWGSSISAVGGGTRTWRIYEGQTAPLLRYFLTSLTVRALDKTYDGTPLANYRLSDPAANLADILGTPVYDNGSGAIINPGSYSQVVIKGLYSHQQGYDLRYVANNIVID